MRGKEAVPGPPQKIDPLQNPRACRTVDVRFCDIDLNDHANSTRYIEWIIDCFPYETLCRSFPALFLINFLAEAVFGDRITLLVETPAHEKRSHVVSLQRDKDGRELARARIDWA
jgi:medium-chain acyl-[acyl-carrier-protein] hydrolase